VKGKMVFEFTYVRRTITATCTLYFCSLFNCSIFLVPFFHLYMHKCRARRRENSIAITSAFIARAVTLIRQTEANGKGCGRTRRKNERTEDSE